MAFLWEELLTEVMILMVKVVEQTHSEAVVAAAARFQADL